MFTPPRNPERTYYMRAALYGRFAAGEAFVE